MRFKKVVFPLLLFVVILIAVFAPLSNDNALAVEPDVWVVVHTNYPFDVVHAMLNDLGNVEGLVLVFKLEDNTTKAIDQVVANMTSWLPAFPDYKIDVQVSYLFPDKYGYLLPEEKGGNYVLNSTACFSDSFMGEYFTALADVFSQYSNVVLFTGYNEPYHHFSNKYLAQEVLKKEYTIFKEKCSWVNFSTEFGMATEFWESFLGFPENVTLEDDIVPFWRDYSDYVGVNVWVDRTSPLSGYDEESETRFNDALEELSEWSYKLGKPIHINEFPCWYEDRVKTIAENYMAEPNICAFYQLCFPRTGAVNDGWEYALYNLNTTDTSFVRNPICYDVYDSVFSNL
ncbi:MAG: hypothetical protein NWF05_08225 [Candidatus Bathyarchaeota archaeon]|nr:hypothetical protein [Candidatus Bathyarchaeota archaeon]